MSLSRLSISPARQAEKPLRRCETGEQVQVEPEFGEGIIEISAKEFRDSSELIGPEAIAAVTPSWETTTRTRMALLRRSGLSFQRRRLVFVFFVHKLKIWGQRPKVCKQ